MGGFCLSDSLAFPPSSHIHSVSLWVCVPARSRTLCTLSPIVCCRSHHCVRCVTIRCAACSICWMKCARGIINRLFVWCMQRTQSQRTPKTFGNSCLGIFNGSFYNSWEILVAQTAAGWPATWNQESSTNSVVLLTLLRTSWFQK